MTLVDWIILAPLAAMLGWVLWDNARMQRRQQRRGVSVGVLAPSAPSILQQLQQAEIARLLGRASAAHHLYEARTGQSDPQWVEWYARWMYDDLHPSAPQVDAYLSENIA